MRGLVVLAIALTSAAVLAVESGRDETGVLPPLPSPARRIVSLAPHITENLFAVGLGARIVGADEYSNYPPAAKQIPRIGRAGALDIERIVALKPDLVIAWESGNTGGQVAQLRRLGLAVMVSEPRTAADIAANLRRFGQVGAGETAAERAALAFEQGWSALQAQYQHRSPVTVFYQIWHEPLMTVNGQHSISAVIRLCGGRNIFAELSNLAPTVNVEAVLRADPQMIIGSGSDDTRPQWLNDWRRWPQLRAVKTQALFDVPPDLMQRPTPRLLEGARQVCAAIDSVRTRALQAGK